MTYNFISNLNQTTFIFNNFKSSLFKTWHTACNFNYNFTYIMQLITLLKNDSFTQNFISTMQPYLHI